MNNKELVPKQIAKRVMHSPILKMSTRSRKVFDMSFVDLISLKGNYLYEPEFDNATFKFISFIKNMTEQQKMKLLKTAKTFIK